jgi:ankyrin repeat protein
MHENVELAGVLINAPGARQVINTADSDFERTPLHLAVRSNAPQVVFLLLKAGASRGLKDILGETSVDYCKRRGETSACQEIFKYAN